MADIASFELWSATAGSNQPDDSDSVDALAENLRTIQAEIKGWLASSGTIASATTTDLSTVDAKFVTVTGTTTITGLGTLAAGIEKVLIFGDALELTYDPSKLILPTNASITTVAGDVASFVSLGSGNWRCTAYLRDDGRQVSGNTTFAAGAEATPSIAFTTDTNTGFYSVGADQLGVSAGGSNVATFASTVTIPTLSATTISAGTSISTAALTGTATVTTPKVTNGANSMEIEAVTQILLDSNDIKIRDAAGPTVTLKVGSSNHQWGVIADLASPYLAFQMPTTADDYIRFGVKATTADQNGINILKAMSFADGCTLSMYGDNLFAINSNYTAASGEDVMRVYADYGTTPDLVWRVTSAGTTFADGAYTATGADYAEYFDFIEPKPQYGETVSLVGESVRVAQNGDTVIGVVSSNPAIVGDYRKDNNDNRVVVGLVGKLQVRKGSPVDSRWIRMREGIDFDLYLVR